MVGNRWEYQCVWCVIAICCFLQNVIFYKIPTDVLKTNILRTHAFLKIKVHTAVWSWFFCCLLVFCLVFFFPFDHILILRDCECLPSRIKLGLELIESCFPVKKHTIFFFLKSWILTFSDNVLDSAGMVVNVHRCEISFVLLWNFVGNFQ